MDFAKLVDISKQAGIDSRHDRSWRFAISEEIGSLVRLLTDLPDGVSIRDLQYGRTANDPQSPVLTLDVPEGEEEGFIKWLEKNQSRAVDVTGQAATRYRVIPFNPALMKSPLFVEVEFPERAGALLGFMKAVSPLASLCYFDYSYSGERVGRALLGLDFSDDQSLTGNRETVFQQAGDTVRSVKEVSIDSLC